MENKSKVLLVLTIGVFAIGVSSILIRLTNAPPIVIATYRVFISSVIIAPLYFTYKNKLPLKEIVKFVHISIFLAAHFTLWITSLKYTTIASSTVLVTTNPIFVPIFSYIFFKERIKKKLILGIAIAISGSFLIALSSKNSIGSGTLFGDVLALLGAVAYSLYFTFGKRVRKQIELIPYIFFTYLLTSLFLILVSLIAKENLFNYSRNTYLMFFLVALIPQLIGHTAYNYSLRYLDPSFIAVTILGEPVIATIGAFFILKEVPTVFEITGAILILVGIYISLLVEEQNSA